MIKALKVTLLALAIPAFALAAEPNVAAELPVATISVDCSRAGKAISPSLYGLFYEEINRAGDGGLYAELVRNRDFRTGLLPEGFRIEGNELVTRSGVRRFKEEMADPLDGWRAEKGAELHWEKAVDEAGTESPVGKLVGNGALVNSGFYGLPVRDGAEYELEVIAKSDHPGSLNVEIISEDGTPISTTFADSVGTDWVTLRGRIKAEKTDSKAALRLKPGKSGTTLFRYVSLMPAEKWKGLPLRPDLVEMLAGLKPAFMRFPGGGFVHNFSLETGWNWKETVAPVERRPGRIGMWGYRSMDGLGYHEFLELCEKLGMEAIPVINSGNSCMAFQYEVAPMEEMGKWVQDALDAIEYANGPASSTWGAVRARNGHPQPFGIKYLSIGNESHGPEYSERFALYEKAIRAKYPEIKLIACKRQNGKEDLVDEHFYQPAEWYFTNHDLYDRSSREGSKIFVSEFASHGWERGLGTMYGALGEAVFMMNMERNSDLVAMCAFAPLFRNVGKERYWPVNLIMFNQTQVYGIPSYYALKMFAESRGDQALGLKVDAPEVQSTAQVSGGIGVGTWETQIEVKEASVQSGAQPLLFVENAQGWKSWKKRRGDWTVTPQGALAQTGDQQGTEATYFNKEWNSYVCSFKVRKVSGKEGVLVTFSQSSNNSKLIWNIGGFGNRVSLVEWRARGERKELTPRVPLGLETGKWHEIKIDAQSDTIRCFLDGKLIHELPVSKAVQPEKFPAVFASASKRAETLFLRAVNVTGGAVRANFAIQGQDRPAQSADLTILSATDKLAENSFEQPRNVFPRKESMEIGGQSFTRILPPYSLTVFELNGQ